MNGPSIGFRAALAVAAAGALVIPAGPAPAQEAASRPLDVHITYTQFTLDNGLTVLVHEDRRLPIVSVNLWYGVGSANEAPGRTGFAHLFEHLMFEGSANVPRGEFDRLLEGAGGDNNGSTSQDRTNYWINVPPGALGLALWLEADRMGWLLETVDQAKLDIQRDVVKNERRQTTENVPYGRAGETILGALYPPDHPYHWPVIGSMEDLSAATLEDVHGFFRTWYAPGNATLSIAGAVSLSNARRLVERYFGGIPAGAAPVSEPVPQPTLEESVRLVLEDDVTLPRLYLAWHSPAAYTPEDAVMDVLASVLTGGKSSRLYRSLVHEKRLAQDVSALQRGQKLGGTFRIVATARPGTSLEALEREIMEEVEALAREGVRDGEIERAVNGAETELVRSLERVGGFGGKADRLNEYLFHTGNPGFVRHDLARFRRVGGSDVAAAGQRLLGSPAVILNVVPRAGGERNPAGVDR